MRVVITKKMHDVMSALGEYGSTKPSSLHRQAFFALAELGWIDVREGRAGLSKHGVNVLNALGLSEETGGSL